jgi:hypothetical protein
MRLKLAVAVTGVVAAIGVSGASGADFDADNGPCRGTSDNGALLRCPTAYVGVPYQVQIESEEGSGCEPYVWYEIVNSVLPPGLSMTRDGLISGVPAVVGGARFWVWNHDLTPDQGGPSWCAFDDRSEREFSIPVDPGLAIVDDSVRPATVGQPYSEPLTAKRVLSLNPRDLSDVQATWSLESGVLPTGLALSPDGVLSGTPTSEGSFTFAVKAQYGTPVDTKTYTLGVRQPLVVSSPFGPEQRPSAEVGVRFAKTVTATGGSGTYTWSLSSGALPSGVALDASNGMLSGTPRAPGSFAFGLTATDGEGRAATVSAALNVAPRLAIKTLRLKPAKQARTYRAALVSVGGIAPVNWRIVRGPLPPGVRFSRKLGTLAGTPRRIGTYRVTVEARDALGAKSQRRLALRVR